MASDPKKKVISNDRLRNERTKRYWTQSDVAGELYDRCNEEELEEHGTIDKNMVSKWERGLHIPGPFWQKKLCELFGVDAETLGFIHQIGTKAADTPQAFPLLPPTKSANLDERQAIQLFISHDTPHVVTIHIHQPAAPTSTYSEENAIIDERITNTFREEYPSEIGSIVKRREFFQEGLRTGAAILTSYDLLNNELLDRFFRALQKPSTIDERTLRYFELRTEGYWQDRHSAALASSDLLSYAIEHLQKVITLLEGSLLPSTRTRLCCIASGIAQLAGHLLFDMGELTQARNFHQLAITAAQEGENQSLEAVSWGRMSFTWTYGGNALEALHCIQEARRLAAQNVNTTVRAYLAAVEAEIQAILGNREYCLKALDVAERVEDRLYPQEEMYWLRFDRSRLAGYQGICFRRLYHPEDARTHAFLNEAQRVLTDALTLLDPARIQRRPALLIDIASTYAQQEDVEGACEQATQALSILAQTKSQAVAKRLLTLRHELEPWNETHSVHNLDQQMIALSILRDYRGIA